MMEDFANKSGCKCDKRTDKIKSFTTGVVQFFNFFSNFRRLLYNKKAHIFLILLSYFTVEKFSVWNTCELKRSTLL